MLRDTVLINACVQQGLLDAALVTEVQRSARRERKDFLTALAFAARMPESSFYRAYAGLHQLPFITGKDIKPSPELLRKLPQNVVERRLMIPMAADADDSIRLVVADPEDKAGIQQIKRLLAKPVKLYMADPKILKQIIKRSVRRSPGVLEDAAVNLADEFDPVKILNDIFDEAYLLGCSDIHFEPLKESLQIRLRVDGRLQNFTSSFTQEEGLSLMSRLKVIASLDISEQRMAQDGSMTHTISAGVGPDVEFDVRVATVPTRFGERATLRLLGSDSDALTLEKIGMSSGDLQRFRHAISQPYGMILITGPTGSGKSTTLYSALQEIATDDINVLTAEDPVEYVMEGISQVHVSGKVTFADALRSFLRHDPDVIMVGEIRDGETASIAMKAAMTGHLVFSTLHTNSAIAAVNRLVDIGTERYLIGATLLAVIAQRLVRRLCPVCKQEKTATAIEQKKLGVDHPVMVYRPKGCPSCMGSGYKGRLALFETFWIDDKVSALIGQGVDESTLQQKATHFYSLAQDGISKALEGKTSLEELERLSLLSTVPEEIEMS